MSYKKSGNKQSKWYFRKCMTDLKGRDRGGTDLKVFITLLDLQGLFVNHIKSQAINKLSGILKNV